MMSLLEDEPRPVRLGWLSMMCAERRLTSPAHHARRPCACERPPVAQEANLGRGRRLNKENLALIGLHIITQTGGVYKAIEPLL